MIDRIKALEKAIAISKEYLASGKNADWIGFRPSFGGKKRNGKELPPHRDWVKNVYLPNLEKRLTRAEKLLDTDGE